MTDFVVVLNNLHFLPMVVFFTYWLFKQYHLSRAASHPRASFLCIVLSPGNKLCILLQEYTSIRLLRVVIEIIPLTLERQLLSV